MALAVCASAQGDKAMEEIQKYRQMLEEGNPADLAELSGQELWSARRGPKQASLEQCDLGLGPGRLEGAYAQLPRYFADTGKVQDAESRLVTCMMTLQGFTFQEATRGWYERDSDIEALVTYVAAQSKGHPIDVPATHAAEAQMVEVGREIFWRRAGPLDFSCATCHSLDGRRIRLQEMPNFTDPSSTRSALVTWPAYRVSAEQRLDHAAAPHRLLPANALARAGVPLRCGHRRRAVPAEGSQRRPHAGAWHQALNPGIKR